APGADCGEIGTGAGFRKALAPDRFALEDERQVKCLLFVGRPGDQGRPGMLQRDEEDVVAVLGRSGAGTFLIPDKLSRDGQAAATIGLGPGDVAPAALVLPAAPGNVEVALRLAACGGAPLPRDV